MNKPTIEKRCCNCGATESFDYARSRQTGETIAIPDCWIELRYRGNVEALRCMSCHDAMPRDVLARYGNA